MKAGCLVADEIEWKCNNQYSQLRKKKRIQWKRSCASWLSKADYGSIHPDYILLFIQLTRLTHWLMFCQIRLLHCITHCFGYIVFIVILPISSSSHRWYSPTSWLPSTLLPKLTYRHLSARATGQAFYLWNFSVLLPISVFPWKWPLGVRGMCRLDLCRGEAGWPRPFDCCSVCLIISTTTTFYWLVWRLIYYIEAICSIC